MLCRSSCSVLYQVVFTNIIIFTTSIYYRYSTLKGTPSPPQNDWFKLYDIKKLSSIEQDRAQPCFWIRVYIFKNINSIYRLKIIFDSLQKKKKFLGASLQTHLHDLLYHILCTRDASRHF